MKATAILHAHHGSPAVVGCADLPSGERCYVCAGPAARGMPVSKWMGATFVGQNRVRSPASRHVCESCVWAMSGKPPDTLRMWSHLWCECHGYERVNKAQKPAIRAFLRAEHSGAWLAAIADSGQKHVVPWTPVNPPGTRGGRVMLEETLVVLPRGDGWSMLDELADLLTAGATKAEAETGDYGPRAWSLCADRIRAFEGRWSGERDGAWFDLALWLAQRDEAEVQARMEREREERAAKKAAEKEATKNATRRSGKGKTANPDGGAGARRARDVPRDAGVQSAQALGPAPGPGASGGAHDGEPRGVGDLARAKPAIAVAEPQQLSLFARPGA